MTRALLAAFATVSLFSGRADFPTGGTVTPALAQGGDVVDRDGLRLPRGHRTSCTTPEAAATGP